MADHIPSDPFILLSFINTKLRDEYPSLNELCASLGISAEQITDRLAQIGMRYDHDLNKFG